MEQGQGIAIVGHGPPRYDQICHVNCRLVHSDNKRLRALRSIGIGISSHIGVGSYAQRNAVNLTRVEVYPLGPVQLHEPTLSGCGPRFTAEPGFTVALLVCCQLPPFTWI